MCGCGDDLNPDEVEDHSPHGSAFQNEDNEKSPAGKGSKWTFHNLTFQRHGQFGDDDVIAVHPATKEDPTKLGSTATDTLRRTRDEYNPALTFSLVIRSSISVQGFFTLDMECESSDSYFLLLRGFILMQEETESKREKIGASGLDEPGAASGFDVAAMWSSAKQLFKDTRSDPIANLFAPVGGIGSSKFQWSSKHSNTDSDLPPAQVRSHAHHPCPPTGPSLHFII